ncbi:MAG: hypothetical protein ACLFU8_07620 [Anaerolineales bacterium]
METGMQEQLAKIYIERALDEAQRVRRPGQRSGRASLSGYIHAFTRALFPAPAIAGRKQI